jgi:hypothetical protein
MRHRSRDHRTCDKARALNIMHRSYSSIFCVSLLGLLFITSCKEEKSSAGKMPHAEAGHLALIAGTGFTGLDTKAKLPDAQIPVPTGMAPYRDGSILTLVNGDGGTLIRITSTGEAEPFEYYRKNRSTGSKDIAFDASQSPQKGWIRQQNSSSLIKTASGDLWIYANRWIASITPDNRAVVIGQLKLPEHKNEFDYQTRLFNGADGEKLLARDGRLYRIEDDLKLKPRKLPKEITETTAAVGDGTHLLLGSKDTVYRVDENRIVDQQKLKLSDNKPAGKVIGIAVDHNGGYFAATSAGVIFHATRQKAPVQVAGVGHNPEESFGGVHNCPPAGHQHLVSNPLAAELGNPESMLLQGDQLYIADAGCSRIYALGI